MAKIRSSEITPEHLYLSRRDLLKGAGLLTAASLWLAACRGEERLISEPALAEMPDSTQPMGSLAPQAMGMIDELGDPLNTFDEINNFNNFYEFTTSKTGVAKLASKFQTEPWTVQLGGLVHNPKTYGIDDLRKKFALEERIYRMRCVEGWSMVIPWLGFPLGSLLREAEPMGDARYMRFETLYDPEQMPGQKGGGYPWPYVEGLRLDEAMHDLTILSTGLYGQELLPQSGAPIRLVVPWKYGFKSIKSIIKIDLVAEQPTSLWMATAPKEYGFYANVNPQVDHPRWSQASERRIGETGRRETLLFNGYAEEVGQLYAAMDLRDNY